MGGKITGRRCVAKVTMGILGALSCAATVGATALPAAAAGPQGPPDVVLDQNRHGEDAIRALGDRLPAVAALNGRTPSEFRAALRADRTLWVDRTGRLLFVDEGPQAATAAAATSDPVEADHPLSETFELHSRPGSLRVIHLDFDGFDASGTAWDKGSNETIAAPYDTDGDPAAFTDAERASIQDVWRRVAEDFAPFAIDVTTQDPGVDAITRSSSSDQSYGTRLVVTPTNVAGCACGGVAYVGVFDATGTTHSYYQPAWVYTTGTGNGAKSVAEAASHEIGHNLGLSHDGTNTSGYYDGQGEWAPIMGVGYYRPITQWSRGEYAGADNQEDDIAVMGGHGAPLVADDHGDTTASATTLTGPDIDVSGMIGTRIDKDAFVLSTAGGVIDLHATPATVSPDLDIELRLVDDQGTTVAVDDPPSSTSSGRDTPSGLDARLTVTVEAGSYTVVIDGVGFGDPVTTGYSDYASVGRYRLSGTIDPGDGTPPPPPPPPPPPATAPEPPSAATATANGSTVTVSWTDGSDDETGFEVVREFLHKNGSWRGTTLVSTTGADATQITDSPGSGTFRYRVRAVNDAGASAYATSPHVTVTGSGGSGGGGSGSGGGGKGHGKR